MTQRSVIAPFYLLATLTSMPLSTAACKTAATERPLPRYIVSAAPLPLVDPRHPGICVAVEPMASPRGVWWWDAGRLGCRGASSGLMDWTATGGTVSRVSTAGTIDVSFQIGLVSGETRKITLELRDGRMRELASGLDVPTERRNDIP
jgi:hypothetical protein